LSVVGVVRCGEQERKKRKRRRKTRKGKIKGKRMWGRGDELGRRSKCR
jgi:hypothetical protein